MRVYDAIVLAGGGGRRLGGVDKASLEVGSRRLLDRALDAVSGAARVVVVGPARNVPHPVISVSEDPPGGGPAAAIAAALPCIESGIAVVLACDMPLVTAVVVERLVAAATPDAAAGASPPSISGTGVPAVTGAHWSGLDGALLVDADGRRQYLAAAYRTTSLGLALAHLGPPDGVAMRHVVRLLTLADVPTDPEVTLDCDTWDDIERCRQLMEGR